MEKFLAALVWLLITSVFIKYSLFFGFNYDAGNVGPLTISFTILWLSAFLKSKN